MYSEDDRRSFLLGMTLNELVFLILFVILIGSALIISDKEKEILDKTQKITELEIITNRLSNVENELVSKEQKLEEAFKRLKLQEEIISRFAGLNTNATPEELDEFFSKLIEAESIKKQLEKYIAENEHLKKQADQLLNESIQVKRQCETQEGQLAYMERKLENCKGGRDFKPCWASKKGITEYMYDVTILENNLRIIPVWPEYRSSEVVITDARKMADRILTIEEFQGLAKPILDISKKGNCRHYVRIYNDESVSTASFKDKMLTVEDYFYKFMPR